MKSNFQTLTVFLCMLSYWHVSSALPGTPAPADHLPPVKRSFDDLVTEVRRVAFGGDIDLAVLVGRAFWTEDAVPYDRSEAGEAPAPRSGNFIVDNVVHWTLDQAAMKVGSVIEFSARPVPRMGRGRMVGYDFDVQFRAHLPTGEEVPCLVLISVSRQDPHRRQHRQVFHLTDTGEEMMRDLRMAAEMIVERPDGSDFKAWRGKVAGPLSRAVLLDAMALDEENVNLVDVPMFAVETLDQTDDRLRSNALLLLKLTPGEVLQQVPAAHLRDTLTRTARRLAGDLDNPGVMNQVERLPEIIRHLPRNQRQELAELLLGQLAPAFDSHFTDQNQRRAARMAESASDPVAQRQGRLDESLGLNADSAYDGPGETYAEGRWIKARQQLETMAR